jgi:hypothetical protein
MCLYNRAVVTRPQHAIFQGPLPVEMNIQNTPTPTGYFHFAFAKECPKTLPTVAILLKEGYPPPFEELGKTPPKPDDPEPGIVTSDVGFLDSPDTESIAGGIHMKGQDYVAIGRQGHVLQWGFYGSPDEMTETGRRVFLNAVYYISTFKGAPILALREQEARDNVALTLGFLDDAYKERIDEVLQREFGKDVPAEVKQGREVRRAWFVSNRPYLYHEGDMWKGRFVIDPDAKELGIPNYDVGLLERCVADLERGSDVDRANRLLARYTEERFSKPAEWRRWLDQNGKELYLSDTAGYKFRIAAPVGQAKTARAPRPDDAARAVTFEVFAYRREGKVSGELKVRIAPGFHIYAPNSKQAAKTVFAVRLPENSPITFDVMPVIPTPASGNISGHFTMPLKLKGLGKRFTVLVDYQACTEQFCLQPVTGKEISCDVRGE